MSDGRKVIFIKRVPGIPDNMERQSYNDDEFRKGVSGIGKLRPESDEEPARDAAKPAAEKPANKK